MKKTIFIPLKEDYEEISIRASELNSYVNPCQFEQKNMESQAETFSLWDRVHDIAQYTMLMWLEKWLECAQKHREEVINCMPYIRFKEYEWFLWAADQYAHLVCNMKLDYIETKRTSIIEYSWYNVYFTWTSDWEEWRTTMIDIKSAWSKWNEEKALSERQKYYYSWLKNTSRWTQDDILFKYIVLTKQKKPQLQVFEFVVPFVEAETYMKSDLKSYLTYIKLNWGK